MRRLFTLMELIIVITAGGIMATVATNSLLHTKQESIVSAISTDIEVVQLAINMYKINKKKLPVDEIIRVGEPRLVDYKRLFPNYLPHKPSQGEFWIDYKGMVYASTIDAPIDLKIAEDGIVNWSEVIGAAEYKVYRVNGFNYEEVSDYKGGTSYSGIVGISYLVACSDRYGKWTPPVNQYYNGIGVEPIKFKSIELEESVDQEQIRVIKLDNLQELISIKSDTGKVEVISTNGNEVTIKVTEGSSKINAIVEGEYTEADTKFVTGEETSVYNKDGYSGVLDRYVHSGLYEPEVTKNFFTNNISSLIPTRRINKSIHTDLAYTIPYSKDGLTGTLTRKSVGIEKHSQAITLNIIASQVYVKKRKEKRNMKEGDKEIIEVFSEELVSMLSKQFGSKNVDEYGDHFDHNITVLEASFLTGEHKGKFYNTEIKYSNELEEGSLLIPVDKAKYKREILYKVKIDGYTYNSIYEGTVVIPEVDTREYRYQGEVSRPEVDNEIHERVYKYNLEVRYK